MKFHFRMYGVSRRMCYVSVTYVWRMKRTRDVSTAYHYFPFLFAAYFSFIWKGAKFDKLREVEPIIKRARVIIHKLSFSLVFELAIQE